MSAVTTGRRAGARRPVVVALVAAVVTAVLVATPVAPSAAATTPGKPKILKVFVKGTSTIKAKWSTGKKATRYQVLVARNKKMTKGRKVYKVKGRSKTVTGLRQGTTYYVKVRSYRGTRKSGWSPRKSVRTLYATPSTPRLSARGTGYSAAAFSWSPSTYATRYRVVITRGPGMAVLQRTPWQYSRAKVLGGLRALPAGSFYYARIEANNAGKASRYSAAVRLSLRPYAPVSPRVAAQGAGSLTGVWTRATSAERYELQARTGSQVVRTVRTNGLGEGVAAVNGLTAGVPYALYVRSISGPFASGWAYVGTSTPRAVRYRLRVGSYNVACANPGTRCSTVHPWLYRRPAVADLIEDANVDVLGLQELSTTNVNSGSTSRSQAGSLNDVLDPRFKYGPYRGTGRWLLYNDDTVEPVAGQGGILTIGYSASVKKPAYAVWQVFTHRGSGQRFVVANAHTEPYVGIEGDRARYKQTSSLVSQVESLPQVQGLPVLYVGDYNSHEFRTYDGPRAVFTQNQLLDGDDFALSRGRWWLNSANGWRNPNPRQGAQVDHVYVPRSVGVRASDVLANTTDSGRWRGRIPSDHNPVVADLDMPAS